MDKKVILSVAGSGKTTYIVSKIDLLKRYLIITYTNANFENLCNRIRSKFNGAIPNNISIFKFDSFLYNILFKAMYSDEYQDVKGIDFDQNNIQKYAQKNSDAYWRSKSLVYSSRLSSFLMRQESLLIDRIFAITDCLIIDEVQDIGSRDFDLIMLFAKANIELLYVGDFYQHTFQTSADGNYRKNLFSIYNKYVSELSKYGFEIDTKTLSKSYRCSANVCLFIKERIGIYIDSFRNDETIIAEIKDESRIKELWNDERIVKLHYKQSYVFKGNHRNWGDVKGEDNFNDVCIILNPTSYSKFTNNNLKSLASMTRAKLYVAITRARGNVYFISSKALDKTFKEYGSI